jgi:hypothetical protein
MTENILLLILLALSIYFILKNSQFGQTQNLPQTYPQDPLQTYPQDPLQTHPQAPLQTYPQDPHHPPHHPPHPYLHPRTPHGNYIISYPVINGFSGIEYDYKTLNDPLIPPYKRDEWNLIVPGFYTRGPPMPFHKYGTLTNTAVPNNDKYKFLFLMGRQKYPGSNSYDYYATGTSDHSDIKFDLPNITKELYNDDKVVISHLENAEYKLIVDRPLSFEYNPYY